MKTVALVTYNDSPTLTPSDTLLIEPLKREGCQGISAPWNDPGIDWKQFDAIILRSCWEYYRTYDKFISWLTHLEQIRANVWNPIQLIKWNSNKSYLKDLEYKGAHVTPTVWLKKNETTKLQDIAHDRGWRDLVLKPTIGASAYGVFRVNSEEYKKTNPKLQQLLHTTDIMVQPLLTEVMSEGEYSFIFIGGNYSHTILKKPKKGEFRSNFQFGSTETIVQLDDVFIQQAKEVLNLVSQIPLYARVDGIINEKQLVLMELELIEPHLFFDLYPPAAVAFAKALKKRLQ